jgi:hypothetical protein
MRSSGDFQTLRPGPVQMAEWLLLEQASAGLLCPQTSEPNASTRVRQPAP